MLNDKFRDSKYHYIKISIHHHITISKYLKPMSYNTKNIITDYVGAEDEGIIAALLATFKYSQAKTFQAEFAGLVGQIDTMKLQKTVFDEDEVHTWSYAMEEGLEDFSKQFPHKKFVFIEADCFGGACIYSGFAVQNGEILFQQSYDHNGHIKLLQEISPTYTEFYFEPFTRDFFVKKGEIKGKIYDFSMAGLFLLMQTDYGKNPDFQVLPAYDNLLLQPQNKDYYLYFEELPQREIKVSGILYQASETILNTIRNILKDSLVGIKHDIEVIVL
jgi:hypothetical protein